MQLVGDLPEFNDLLRVALLGRSSLSFAEALLNGDALVGEVLSKGCRIGARIAKLLRDRGGNSLKACSICSPALSSSK